MWPHHSPTCLVGAPEIIWKNSDVEPSSAYYNTASKWAAEVSIQCMWWRRQNTRSSSKSRLAEEGVFYPIKMYIFSFLYFWPEGRLAVYWGYCPLIFVRVAHITSTRLWTMLDWKTTESIYVYKVPQNMIWLTDTYRQQGRIPLNQASIWTKHHDRRKGFFLLYVHYSHPSHRLRKQHIAFPPKLGSIAPREKSWLSLFLFFLLRRMLKHVF